MSRSAVAQNRAHNPRRAHARRRQSRQGVRLDRQSLRAMLTGFVIGATAFVLLAGVTVLSFYLYFQLSGRILLGVRAGDVPLGNRTTEEAASRLIAAWLENRQQLALVEGERRWQVSPEDFGLVLDADATAERAAEVGRGGTILEEMRVTADAALTGYRIAPVVTLDEAIARQALTALAAEVNEPPVDASLRFENGKPVAVPGVPGGWGWVSGAELPHQQDLAGVEGINSCPWCNDLHDIAFDHADSFFGIFHLLRNRHLVAQVDQDINVLLNAVMGHTRHRNGIIGIFIARCQSKL